MYKAATANTGATFQIKNSKLYVPAVTLSINDNIKCLEKYKASVWKNQFRYKCEVTSQAKAINWSNVWEY